MNKEKNRENFGFKFADFRESRKFSNLKFSEDLQREASAKMGKNFFSTGLGFLKCFLNV